MVDESDDVEENDGAHESTDSPSESDETDEGSKTDDERGDDGDGMPRAPEGVPSPVFARAGQKTSQKAVAVILMAASPPKNSVTSAMIRISSILLSSRRSLG